MDSNDIQRHINELLERERELRAEAPSEGEDAARSSELRRIEEQLDQAWDLLRQRRAKEHAGENPEEAEERPVDEVEGYRQ